MRGSEWMRFYYPRMSHKPFGLDFIQNVIKSKLYRTRQDGLCKKGTRLGLPLHDMLCAYNTVAMEKDMHASSEDMQVNIHGQTSQ